jgi:hypothetical protein
MTDDCFELRDLNFKTFRAEEGGETRIDGKSWKGFLQDSLADEFQIMRAKAGTPQQNQNKSSMIAWIENHPREGVLIKEQTVVSWSSESLGVLICCVTLNGKNYQNIKVFTKKPQVQSKCIYWQVTQLTPDE